MSILKYLLKEAEFQTLGKFVSPAFFSVVPVGESLGIISKVLKSARDPAALESARQQVGQVLAPIRVKVVSSTDVSGTAPSTQLGERILQAYFRQILYSQVWLLDFRRDRWSMDGSEVGWAPASYIHSPSPKFLQAVRALYRGFYQVKSAEFDHALGELGIASAKAEILAHFGISEQSAVVFSLSEFQATFARVFESCRKSGSRIHPEFALLGAMLVSLYEALEPIRGGLNVRKCFELSDAEAV